MAHFSTAPRERSLKRCSPHGGRAAMEEWLMATENAKRMQQTDDAWNGRDWDAVRPAPWPWVRRLLAREGSGPDAWWSRPWSRGNRFCDAFP